MSHPFNQNPSDPVDHPRRYHRPARARVGPAAGAATPTPGQHVQNGGPYGILAIISNNSSNLFSMLVSICKAEMFASFSPMQST